MLNIQSYYELHFKLIGMFKYRTHGSSRTAAERSGGAYGFN